MALASPVAGAPGDVEGALLAELGEILEVRFDDAALELLQRLDRWDAAALPVANIRAGTDPLAAPLKHLQLRVGVPVIASAAGDCGWRC